MSIISIRVPHLLYRVDKTTAGEVTALLESLDLLCYFLNDFIELLVFDGNRYVLVDNILLYGGLRGLEGLLVHSCVLPLHQEGQFFLAEALKLVGLDLLVCRTVLTYEERVVEDEGEEHDSDYGAQEDHDGEHFVHGVQVLDYDPGVGGELLSVLVIEPLVPQVSLVDHVQGDAVANH